MASEENGENDEIVYNLDELCVEEEEIDFNLSEECLEEKQQSEELEDNVNRQQRYGQEDNSIAIQMFTTLTVH